MVDVAPYMKVDRGEHFTGSYGNRLIKDDKSMFVMGSNYFPGVIWCPKVGWLWMFEWFWMIHLLAAGMCDGMSAYLYNYIHIHIISMHDIGQKWTSFFWCINLIFVEALRRILIASNGMAAAKSIMSMRQWAHMEVRWGEHVGENRWCIYDRLYVFYR